MSPLPPALPLTLPPSHAILPFLWLALTLSLLFDARRSRKSASPRLILLLLAVAAFSIALVAAFHHHYLTTPHLHPITRQASDDFPTADPPTPTPSAPPASQPVTQSPLPAPPPPPSPLPQQQQPFADPGPTLDQCAAPLTRMQVFLLLEGLAEAILLGLRLFSSDDPDEPTLNISFRMFTGIRGVYAIIVLIINVSIVWIGGGRVGECLPIHPELQITYAHLVLYAVACIFFVILRMYRLTKFDSEKRTADPTTTDSRSYQTDSRYPPTRTSSSYDRRRDWRPGRHASGTSSRTSYEEPRFRLDCGCCTINL